MALAHDISDTERARLLRAIGVDVWELRRSADEVPVSDEAQPDVVSPGWGGLESEVRDCTRCGLHEGRTQTVFGVGNREAEWMIIGEAPGADEDRQGEPFVGRAGQLLNQMLLAIGLARQDVFIANILKCRPPRNRDPKTEEVSACIGYLERQVALVKPRIILAVGRIAAQNLLHQDQPVGKLRGNVYAFGPDEIPVVVTYHPAYLLRSPAQKRKAWSDLCLARRLAGGEMQ